MTTRSRIASLVLSGYALGAALVAAPAAQAISGIEGTFEFAFDAPWRIEPRTEADGTPSWGAIPIQLTIHDANIVLLDRGLRTTYVLRNGETERVAVPLPGPQRLGAFCSLTVTESASGASRHYAFEDLAEVERSRGRWRDESDAAPSQHDVCRIDQGERCPGLATITGSSEWYALAWYPVPAGSAPGSMVRLAIEMEVSRDPREPCVSGDPAKSITLRNHVAVRLGRAPLPRFGSGWLYGDLHYHSQGTDNEGESGHNYRGVVRAMGALGLDFAFATEHASASDQVIDGDVWLSGRTLHIRETRNTLRDMNDERFRTLLALLHGPDGVNQEAARRGYVGLPPQTARVAGTVPQIFLGGEVDVIPETDRGFPRTTIPFGNGLLYQIGNLCGGWNANLADWFGACNILGRFEEADDGVLLRDIQGLNDSDFARWHLVYLPRRASDADAFVPSYTGRYGGGGRRLADPHAGRGPVGPEMRQHGYAFLAHPLAGLGVGSPGPDLTPWSEHALRKAFAEPAILGLQLWNENQRLSHKLTERETIGYERPDELFGTQKPDESVREGFYTGHFELDASGFLEGDATYTGAVDGGPLFKIAHGAYTWDRMNLWGIDPSRTASLDWIEPGEPRRVLMAGGSDAHGDLNYRREGYFLGDTKLNDTAIGTPRNLVHVGIPLPVLDPAGHTTGTMAIDYGEPDPEPGGSGIASASTLFTATASFTATESGSGATSVGGGGFPAATVAGGPTTGEVYDSEVAGTPPTQRRTHAQIQVVDAIADGRFAVTDGPALRIVVDRNHSGAIDAGDTPMGGVVDLYGEDSLPLLVEWQSTADFGPVEGVDLVVGVEGGGQTRLYAPVGHGPRALGVPVSTPVESYFDFWQYQRGEDDYWRVDAQRLHLDYGTGVYAGIEAVDLDLRALVAGRGVPGERYFVRAFARTRAAIPRHAFTNPIWALQRDAASCPADAPRALDRDGDGMPDGCDPCPTRDQRLSGSTCYDGPSGFEVYDDFGASGNGGDAGTGGLYSIPSAPLLLQQSTRAPSFGYAP